MTQQENPQDKRDFAALADFDRAMKLSNKVPKVIIERREFATHNSERPIADETTLRSTENAAA
ncbi:MAG: hypothetical protein KF774_16420 [Planctomyces sp.]|nr:hypothetical protein [Planctomyces sp.]